MHQWVLHHCLSNRSWKGHRKCPDQVLVLDLYSLRPVGDITLEVGTVQTDATCVWVRPEVMLKVVSEAKTEAYVVLDVKDGFCLGVEHEEVSDSLTEILVGTELATVSELFSG
jgi:hypothetical protein